MSKARGTGHEKDPVGANCRDGEIVRRLLEWYEHNGRRFPWREGKLQPWQVLVVEILLQQTSADRVSRFVPGFFAEYGTLDALLRVDQGLLAGRLASLGLYRRRSKTLHALAAALVFRKGKVPNSKEELQSLPGVGPYVAAGYLSVALNRAEPMVDVNMARLVERLYGPRTLVDVRYDPHINGIARRLIELAPRPNEFNWAVLDIGAIHCKARSPRCDLCPLLNLCPYGERQLAERYPT